MKRPLKDSFGAEFPSRTANGAASVGRVVDQNIETLVRRREEESANRSLSEKIADRVTDFTGSMPFVYLHLLMFGFWIVVNLGWVRSIPKFDPSFVILAMVASVEAIFLSTFVLITQNRMAVLAEKRAELDLQVSLLAEHEITRLLGVVLKISEKLGVAESHDPELKELARDAHPERILDRIEDANRS
jgi:uncharacterized membrane protein